LSVKKNIVTAMKVCGIEAISEGSMYKALFSRGLSCDDATQVVKELLEDGTLRRSGCGFLLTADGKKNTFRQGSVCDS
jgi:hypothetical protein